MFILIYAAFSFSKTIRQLYDSTNYSGGASRTFHYQVVQSIELLS